MIEAANLNGFGINAKELQKPVESKRDGLNFLK
jgi:hypothetical protein